jgi:hypothetical protein
MRVGDRVQLRAPIAYVGRFGSVVSVRKLRFLHPKTKYVVRVDDGPLVSTGAVKKETTCLVTAQQR